jgi:anion-transporting  ArsA/GET3 family ATPase
MAILNAQKLIVVTGKGGVGKSTIAAAWAVSSARRGLKTLVCQVNADDRMGSLLGHESLGPEITRLEENLWAVNVRPYEAMREYALMRLKFETLYNAVFENRLVRYFLRFVPSLAELVMLGKILYHVKEADPGGHPIYDRIIIDAPATGHAVTFLNVAQVILDTVPPGPMATDARWMRDTLVDPEVTTAVLVSLPEEMPVNETIELSATLKQKVGIQPGVIILNGAIASRFSQTDIEAIPHAALKTLALSQKERADLTSGSFRKLAESTTLPVHTVPRLYLPRFDRKAIEDLALHLAPLWEGQS